VGKFVQSSPAPAPRRPPVTRGNGARPSCLGLPCLISSLPEPRWETSCRFLASPLPTRRCDGVLALPLPPRCQGHQLPDKARQSSAALRLPTPSHLSPAICHVSPLLRQSCHVVLAPSCCQARAPRACPRAAFRVDNRVQTGLQLHVLATQPLTPPAGTSALLRTCMHSPHCGEPLPSRSLQPASAHACSSLLQALYVMG
jgi:hypothetical protein